MADNNDNYFRVISNQVRFGCGYRTVRGGKRQYYAWLGEPNRNDDYFTTTSVTWAEFEEIQRDYPAEIIADRKAADEFYDKYIKDHHIIAQGWNKIL